MSKSVIILGGGVAGLSAAHELIERGFSVKVYELKNIPGGKARSIPVPGSGKDGRKDLPGEHGFRFFPGFYKHITDTMKRIPYKNNPNGVFGNLEPAPRSLLARFKETNIEILARFPQNLNDLIALFKQIFDSDWGVSEKEIIFFSEKVWQLFTSCKERRANDYEKLAWWDYTEAAKFSQAYRDLFVIGLTRTLAASRAENASTKTGGDILIQLIRGMTTPGMAADRILKGPTNEIWINPWLDYLKSKGVEYFLDTNVLEIVCNADKGNIEKVRLSNKDGEFAVNGDYYIAAVPVEVMSRFLNDSILKVDPTLKGILELKKDVQWMNGIQFYLNKDVKIVKGHAMYLDSPWALTSISQLQFWGQFPISNYGNGEVQGILSIDISDWNTNGILYNKPAKNCTKDEIKEEVWAQLKASLNKPKEEPILKDDYLVTWFIDPDIKQKHIPKGEELFTNAEPLLVNNINTWELRPTAHTRVKNLFLASDYVRTYTDLATMEGANEAARRAVNCIIDAANLDSPYCEIWDLHEPDILIPFRIADQIRYNKGLPWNGELNLWNKAKRWLNTIFGNKK